MESIPILQKTSKYQTFEHTTQSHFRQTGKSKQGAQKTDLIGKGAGTVPKVNLTLREKYPDPTKDFLNFRQKGYKVYIEEGAGVPSNPGIVH